MGVGCQVSARRPGLMSDQGAKLVSNESDKSMAGSRPNSQPPTPDPLEKIKSSVRAITAYTLAPYRASIKINQNENPFDMPDEIKREVERRLAHRAWSRYPDFVPSELLESLASFAGWKPEGTLAGNGSNELIQATLIVTVSQGARVLIPEPTFTLYRQIVTVLGGEVLSAPLTPELQFDVEAIRARAISGRADLIILCSPNNPTGC